MQYSTNEFPVGPSSSFLNESTNNLLMFTNVWINHIIEIVFCLCCYFRPIFVLLNLSFIFSKILILSLIDKETAGT